MVNIDRAREIMGSNFIGPDELLNISVLNLIISDDIPDIPYNVDYLREKKDDYILVLGVDKFSDGTTITIRNLKKIFGQDPQVFEPCFYNQDWYECEKFIDKPMNSGWFMIRKTVIEDSRTRQPNELMKIYSFPSAISCTYAFFTAWFSLGVKLWYHDFVWCSDKDHNGDRIYVGKYHDIDGVNKNGFSIHRHLSLRQCYGCVDIE